MSDANFVMSLWRKLSAYPGGKWLFSRIVCRKAPYFASIRPQFIELESGHSVARVVRRRSVTNHLGTVHAIASCNLAEFAAGTMIEATLPRSHRWIPKGMTVEYLKPADGDVVADARLTLPELNDESVDVPIFVDVTCGSEVAVRAKITMWVSQRPASKGTSKA